MGAGDRLAPFSSESIKKEEGVMDQMSMPVPIEKAQNTQVQVAIEYAKITASQDFQSLLRNAASFTPAKAYKVTDRETMLHAIDINDAMKRDLKTAEEMRKDAVAVPNAYVALVNDTFKQLKNQLELIKKHLSDEILRQKTMEEEEFKKQQEALQKAAEEAPPPVMSMEVDGVSVVQTGAMSVFDAPQMQNVIKTESGAKTHTREDLSVKVVDMEAFLKAVISKAKGYEYLTVDLVEVKIGALKMLIKEQKKKKVPGVEIEMKKTLV
jgi:hypothetical protein